MIKPDTLKFATDDVVVYLAAAGAGKTSAIMDEMTKLLKVYRPDEIAFVTFTRKGVSNGIERALAANPYLAKHDLVHFKTLHALCFRELELPRTAIIERRDIAKFNKLLGFKVTLSDTFEKQTEDDRLLSRYDAERDGSTKGIFVHGAYDEMRYTRLTKAYEVFKQVNGLVDFHDCLLKFRDAAKPVGVKVAFIDEAQDLTLLQWEVCQIAFSKCEKIRIAGDDFQSLFTYAGASPRTLVELAKKYETVKLETSYRLPKTVYTFAKGITNIIADKIDKDFKPAKDVDGFVKDVSDRAMLLSHMLRDTSKNGFPPNRWYLLFRNNCFIDNMARQLELAVIPYHTAHGFCIARADIMRIKRYYNYRKSGYGIKDAFEQFCYKYGIKDIQEDFTESNLIPSERRYIYLNYVEKYGALELEMQCNSEPSILLSTTHRVKGGEADYVAVFMDCTRMVKSNAIINIDEELRVFYVACTRAKTGLYLVASDGKLGLDAVIDVVREQMP